MHQEDPNILDWFTVEGIKRSRAAIEELENYHWLYYSELAHQRSKIAKEIKLALLKAAISPPPFKKWQRALKIRWSLQPLSPKGSLTIPGQRFNYGNIGGDFRSFLGFYIAEDFSTALCELVGQKIRDASNKKDLSALELALTDTQSKGSFSVSGSLDTVIDLTQPKRLRPFLKLIEKFTLSENLKKIARRLKIPPPTTVKNLHQLMVVLREKNWRGWPMQVKVPAPCQIFGALVFEAGIQGIIYPSAFTDSKCLVVFPTNFQDMNSYVELDDDLQSTTIIRRLDRSTLDKLMNA